MRPLRLALAGAGALAAAMGVGRFAYTALLPSVQRGLGLDDAAGGAIAAANMAGYLVGVLAVRRAAPRWHSRLLAAGLWGSAATTGLVALAEGPLAWAALRFLSGLASGLCFVLVSTAVLEALPAGRAALGGLLYAGVGAGIALSGAVAAATAHQPWPLAWTVLAAASALLAVPARGIPAAAAGAARQAGGPASRSAPALPDHAEPVATRGEGITLRRLAVAYFLEGLGYIVSGTFAVAAVQRTPGLEAWAPWVWVAAGMAAVPSAVLWGWAASRLGSRRALAAAYALQAAGMALPALSSRGAAAVAGALLFGGTFMGIVTAAMALARRLDPRPGGGSIGTMAALYGAGQVAGPLLAGLLSRATGGPRLAVLMAAAAVGLGAALLSTRSDEAAA